jgi:hypothetical protein
MLWRFPCSVRAAGVRVAGRNPAAAVQAFLAPVQAAFGLFAAGNVIADTYRPGSEGFLVFRGGEVVTLHGASKVGLGVRVRYSIIRDDRPGCGPWRVTTTGYMYELQRDGTTLYEYRWHPRSRSHEVRPHLHCTAVGKAHIPTGRVMVEDALNLAVQHGAKPNSLARWQELDALNREKFARSAVWGAGPPQA